MDDSHVHVWVTDYIELDWNQSSGSGMRCACGATLNQLEVENALNDYESMKAVLRSSGVESLCTCGRDENRHHLRQPPPPPVPEPPPPQLIEVGDGSPRTKMEASFVFLGPIVVIAAALALWLVSRL